MDQHEMGAHTYSEIINGRILMPCCTFDGVHLEAAATLRDVSEFRIKTVFRSVRCVRWIDVKLPPDGKILNSA